MGVAFHLFYEWWREGSGICVILTSMRVRACVLVCVGGMWLVKCENVNAHCFPVKISVPNHRVTPLVFYLQLIFHLISLLVHQEKQDLASS